MRRLIKVWQMRFAIVALGVLLGNIARFIMPPAPDGDPDPPRTFQHPLDDDAQLDFPLTGL